MLLDPNTLSPTAPSPWPTGSPARTASCWPTASRGAGSDWQEWQVRDVETGQEDCSDELKWVKFSRVAWTQDGKGFFYSRFDEPKPGEQYTKANYYQKLYYHRLGTPQERGRAGLRARRPEGMGLRRRRHRRRPVPDHHRLARAPSRRTRSSTRTCSSADAPVVELLDGFDAEYEFIDNDGPVFWFVTDLDAPRGA